MELSEQWLRVTTGNYSYEDCRFRLLCHDVVL